MVRGTRGRARVRRWVFVMVVCERMRVQCAPSAASATRFTERVWNIEKLRYRFRPCQPVDDSADRQDRTLTYIM